MFENLYLKFAQWIFLFLGITIFGSFWFIVAGYFWKRRHSRENKYPYLPVIVSVLGGLFIRYECKHYGPIVIGWVWMGIGLVGFLVTLRLANTKSKDVALQQKIQRGNQVITTTAFQKLLDKKQDSYLVERHKKPLTPQLMIGGIRLPNYLENLGFFFVGSPGSGKSVGIAELLYITRQRDDFRGIIFDRNGELTEKLFDPERDLIFNPIDARSVNWSHLTEQARPETIASALVPDDPKEPFFSDAARSLLSDLYERCSSNSALWETLSKLSLEELTEFVKGGVSHRYFISDKTGGSVLSTLINFARFYKELPDIGEPFSFIEWARSDDSRWLFLPLFEEDSELYKPLYSAAFELALKGLLSNEGRCIKTAVVIDELGALKGQI